MSEEEILNYLEKVSKEKTIMPLDNYIQGLLDLYEKEKLNSFSLSDKLNKEKEKNKALKEGLKYRINYCKLLEKELYANGVNYEFEKTEIEKQFSEE